MTTYFICSDPESDEVKKWMKATNTPPERIYLTIHSRVISWKDGDEIVMYKPEKKDGN